jgi:hypothetical protein
MRELYKILVGNSERERQLGRQRHRSQDNDDMGSKAKGYGDKTGFVWLRMGV